MVAQQRTQSVKVVAVANRKGGVGKTTTAANLAAALALDGERVLAVDLDPQGSLGRALGVAAVADEGASAAFRSKGRWRYARPAAGGLDGLAVVAADDRLELEAAKVAASPARGRRLRRRLDGAVQWSVAVLDTPPGVHGIAAAALDAADAVVVPVAADYLALDALRGTIDALRRLEKSRRRQFAPLLVLPTFVDPRRPGSAAALALLKERFAELVVGEGVPRSARFDSAALAATPVVVAYPATPAAASYRAAARELGERLAEATPARRAVLKGFAGADVRDALRRARSGQAALRRLRGG